MPGKAAANLARGSTGLDLLADVGRTDEAASLLRPTASRPQVVGGDAKRPRITFEILSRRGDPASDAQLQLVLADFEARDLQTATLVEGGQRLLPFLTRPPARLDAALRMLEIGKPRGWVPPYRLARPGRALGIPSSGRPVRAIPGKVESHAAIDARRARSFTATWRPALVSRGTVEGSARQIEDVASGRATPPSSGSSGRRFRGFAATPCPSCRCSHGGIRPCRRGSAPCGRISRPRHPRPALPRAGTARDRR